MMNAIVVTITKCEQITCILLQPNHHRQHNITPFLTDWMSSLLPTQQCQTTEGLLLTYNAIKYIDVSKIPPLVY